MNIQEWRKLGEALEWWDRTKGPDFNQAIHNMAEIARQIYDRWQECDNCAQGIDPFAEEVTPEGLPEGVKVMKPGKCRVCGGSGLQPNQARDKSFTPVWLNRAFDKETDDV